MADSFHTLPVTLFEESPAVVQRIASEPSRGEVDIQERGLHIGFRDSDPWWCAVIFHNGEQKAKIDCLSDKEWLVEALKTEEPDTLFTAFHILL